MQIFCPLKNSPPKSMSSSFSGCAMNVKLERGLGGAQIVSVTVARRVCSASSFATTSAISALTNWSIIMYSQVLNTKKY